MRRGDAAHLLEESKHALALREDTVLDRRPRGTSSGLKQHHMPRELPGRMERDGARRDQIAFAPERMRDQSRGRLTSREGLRNRPLFAASTQNVRRALSKKIRPAEQRARLVRRDTNPKLAVEEERGPEQLGEGRLRESKRRAAARKRSFGALRSLRPRHHATFCNVS